MDLSAPSATAPSEAEKLLRPYVGGERGGKLRSQLARLHRDTPMEKIEEAIQTACDLFVDKGEGISAPGQVYAWVRTTAHRLLTREEDQRVRELPIDPTHESLQEIAAEEPGPAEEAIAHEDEAELVALVREVSDSLPERKREILALYGAGYKRPEIASRLGLSERAVKRDLLEIMDEARVAIARKAGGGCLRGEPLILRFAYGLASAAEAEQARFHMKGCHRCEMLWERLDAWREKVVVVLPAPAIRLRGDPEVASRYAALKRGLAEQHRDDRDAYTEAKSAFVRAILQGDPARFLSTEELTIRQATADDVPSIAEVHVRSWQAAYRGILADDLLDSLSVAEREGRWRVLLSNTEHHWLNLVAEDRNGGLAGFCAVTTLSREAKEDESLPEVGALYVDPDRWREGAGAAMLIAACERLKKRGWQEVVLWVLPENRRALAFYARYGFTIDKGVEKLEERSGRPVIRLRASLPLSQSVLPLQKPGDHPATGG